jgi:hypothetical protein
LIAIGIANADQGASARETVAVTTYASEDDAALSSISHIMALLSLGIIRGRAELLDHIVTSVSQCSYAAKLASHLASIAVVGKKD